MENLEEWFVEPREIENKVVQHGFVLLEMKRTMEHIEIKTFKNYKIGACLFRAKRPIREILIIASATGVRQQYYEPFAIYLTTYGLDVFTFDYTGIGKSLTLPLRKVKATVLDWANNDLESVILYVKRRFPQSKIHLLGHSLGGQILGLAPSSVNASNVIIVASQTGYWRFWKGWSRCQFWFLWYILIPGLSNLFGYLPSKKIMGMENLPKSMTQQWSRWCRHKNYLFDVVDAAQRYYDEMESNLFSFSIEDDILAPRETVDWLTAQYKKARVQRIHLKAEDYQMKSIGHFGVFRREAKETIWPLLLRALLNK